MSALVPMVKLEAVNVMLAAIGEAPVSTLATTGLLDVSVAETILDNVTREVLMRGWWFNREYDYPLAKNGSNEFVIGATALSVDSSAKSANWDVVERAGKLYDRYNHTFTFTDIDTLYIDVVWSFDFTELPQVVRWYITVRASRIFQTDTVGSDTLNKFTSTHESEALTYMQQAEGNAEDFNIAQGTGTNAIINRHFNPRR